MLDTTKMRTGAGLLMSLLLTLLCLWVPSVALAQGRPGDAKDGGYGRTACGDSHRVRAGETLTGIAAQYGVSLSALLEKNNLKDANLIYVDQELCLPKSWGDGYSNNRYGGQDSRYGEMSHSKGGPYQGDGYEDNKSYGYQNDGYGGQSHDYGYQDGKPYDYQKDGYGYQNDGYGYQDNKYKGQKPGYGYQKDGYGDQYGNPNEGYGYQDGKPYDYQKDGYGYQDDRSYGNQNGGYGYQDNPSRPHGKGDDGQGAAYWVYPEEDNQHEYARPKGSGYP